MKHFKNLDNSIDLILGENASAEEKLSSIVSLLKKGMGKYTWVGFYFMNDATEMLHLGPYAGKETEHTIIPYGKGICGQVAVSGKTYLADDVNTESNYIACSLDVRSEIVVPIYYGEKLVAQLDIDSNLPHAFNKEDERFLLDLCVILGERMGDKLAFANFFK